MVHSSLSMSQLRSAFTRCWNTCDKLDRVNSIVSSRTRRDEEKKYAELLQGDGYRLVVVGMEVGGPLAEALQFVEMLATVRAREAPRVQLSWRRMVAHVLNVVWQSFCQFVRFAIRRTVLAT